MNPHIRVLRAEAKAISDAAPLLDTVSRFWAESLAAAKRTAADQLEAEEAELAQRIEPKPGDATFNPKGKPNA